MYVMHGVCKGVCMLQGRREGFWSGCLKVVAGAMYKIGGEWR